MGLFIGGLGAYLLVGVPIAMALGMASFTYLLVSGNMSMMAIFPQRMLGSVNQFVLLTIPMFLLAGNLMNQGGITHRILAFANACVGHRKGGLSLVNVVSSMFFGGVSGAAARDSARSQVFSTGTIWRRRGTMRCLLSVFARPRP